MLRYVLIFVAVLFIAPLACGEESQDNVVIKIRAINPLEEKASITIRYSLPIGLTSEDILAKYIKRGNKPTKRQNFKIRLDKEKKTYFVDQPMTLAPKEVVVLEIEVKDVWAIPAQKLDDLQAQTENLLKTPIERESTSADFMNDGSAPDPIVIKLKEEILRQLEKISATQEANTIAKAGVTAHIDAYRKNAETLKQVQMDIAMLENILGEKETLKKEELLEDAPLSEPPSLPKIPVQSEEQAQPPLEVGQDQPVPSASIEGENRAVQPAATIEPFSVKPSIADKLRSWFRRR